MYFDSTLPEGNATWLSWSLFLCGPQGTPEIKEHYIDSKKDVDRHLKFSCEQFIQQQTQIFVGNLEEFLTKVTVRAKAELASGSKGSSWPSFFSAFTFYKHYLLIQWSLKVSVLNWQAKIKWQFFFFFIEKI